MADLIITPADVTPRGGVRQQGIAGAAIAAGQMIYLDPADNTYKLADCDNASAEVRKPDGIAVNSAAAGQPVVFMGPGTEVSLGAVLTAGTTYYLSPNPGGIAPFADLGTGDYPVIAGIAASSSVLKISLLEAGVALA
jgi:hypothetical protein